jgi:hypothetical protein
MSFAMLDYCSIPNPPRYRLLRSMITVSLLVLIFVKGWFLFRIVYSYCDPEAERSDIVLAISLGMSILIMLIADVWMASIVIKCSPIRRWLWPVPLFVSLPGNFLIYGGCWLCLLSAGMGIDRDLSWTLFAAQCLAIVYPVLLVSLCLRMDRLQRSGSPMVSRQSDSQEINDA